MKITEFAGKYAGNREDNKDEYYARFAFGNEEIRVINKRIE